jgi:hypothetical protein
MGLNISGQSRWGAASAVGQEPDARLGTAHRQLSANCGSQRVHADAQRIAQPQRVSIIANQVAKLPRDPPA